MKLILGIILSVVLVVGFISTYATEQDNIKQLETDIEQLETNIEKQQRKIDTLQRIIDRSQSLIDMTQLQINEKNISINELKNLDNKPIHAGTQEIKQNNNPSSKNDGNGYCVVNCNNYDLKRNKQLETEDSRWITHVKNLNQNNTSCGNILYGTKTSSIDVNIINVDKYGYFNVNGTIHDHVEGNAESHILYPEGKGSLFGIVYVDNDGTFDFKKRIDNMHKFEKNEMGVEVLNIPDWQTGIYTLIVNYEQKCNIATFEFNSSP